MARRTLTAREMTKQDIEIFHAKHNRLLDRVFEATWDVLADEGWCDARGAAEWLRINSDWIDSGRTQQMVKFIQDGDRKFHPEPESE